LSQRAGLADALGAENVVAVAVARNATTHHRCHRRKAASFRRDTIRATGDFRGF
jgi:hypothetical protein